MGDCSICGKLQFLRTVAFFLETAFSFMGVDLPFFIAAALRTREIPGCAEQ